MNRLRLLRWMYSRSGRHETSSCSGETASSVCAMADAEMVPPAPRQPERNRRIRYRRTGMSWLNPDGRLLLVTRTLRSFGYGYLTVVVALYLSQLGLSTLQIGFILTGALAGSAVMNVFWSLRADAFGRRRTVQVMG